MKRSEFTREEALRLHYKMWTEMQEKLGDNPLASERNEFKRDWCHEWARNNNYNQGDGVPVRSNCFLCEYADGACGKCPIDWAQAEYIDNSCENRGYVVDCTDKYINWTSYGTGPYYKFAPISKILAIPERSEAT